MSTCGLTLVHLKLRRPATSISLSKWPMLQTMAMSLHLAHVVDGDDVLVAGGGDDDVGAVRGVLERHDLEAVHRGLQRADRIDFGDQHAGAGAAAATAAEPLPTSP